MKSEPSRLLTLALAVLILAGCGEPIEATAAQPEDRAGGSILLDALGPLPERYGNHEYLKTQTFVLVDDAAEPVPSGNAEFPLFTIRIDALTQRDGSVGYHAFAGNLAEGLPLRFQCDHRRGVMIFDSPDSFRFVVDGQLDTVAAFDSDAMGCGPAPEPHAANDILGESSTTIARSGEVLTFTTVDGDTWRFAPLVVEESSPPTSRAPAGSMSDVLLLASPSDVFFAPAFEELARRYAADCGWTIVGATDAQPDAATSSLIDDIETVADALSCEGVLKVDTGGTVFVFEPSEAARTRISEVLLDSGADIVIDPAPGGTMQASDHPADDVPTLDSSDALGTAWSVEIRHAELLGTRRHTWLAVLIDPRPSFDPVHVAVYDDNADQWSTFVHLGNFSIPQVITTSSTLAVAGVGGGDSGLTIFDPRVQAVTEVLTETPIARCEGAEAAATIDDRILLRDGCGGPEAFEYAGNDSWTPLGTNAPLAADATSIDADGVLVTLVPVRSAESAVIEILGPPQHGTG